MKNSQLIEELKNEASNYLASFRPKWKGLNLIGMVEAERHIGADVSVEQRYYSPAN